MSEDIEKVDTTNDSNEDELLEGMSVSEIDPAILLMSEAVEILRYTKEELLGIRELPLSKEKPDIVDLIDVIPSIFDPEKWNLERKKSDTPPENGKPDNDHRRRNGDPRERIKKENDGIVLSPQRRSFNTGCFVPGRESASTRNTNEGGHVGIREIQTGGTRRIGSGRIIRESWGDFSDKPDHQPENDFAPYRSGPSSQNRGQHGDREDKYSSREDKYPSREDKYNSREEKFLSRDDKYSAREDKYLSREDKYERRSFGRDFEANRGDRGDMTRDRGEMKEKEVGRKNGRYSERRRYTSDHSRDEEPEWFSSGPISQNDTIELRGFDDCDRPGIKKKLSPSRVKRAKEWSKKKNENQSGVITEEKEKDVSKDHSESTEPKEQPDTNSNKKINNNDQAKGESSSFNFDDILKCDSIPGLLTNGVGSDGDAAKSRFSRWFKKESPEKLDSRRSSIQEDNHIIKDLLKDINETNVTIPGDSESYFAPISPAANTGGGGVAKHVGQPISFVEMFQRSQQRQPDGGLNSAPKQPQIAGKILSLDELEAKIRQKPDVTPNIRQQQKPQQKPDEEMTAAFKRMLVQAQDTGTQNGPVPKPQAMSLLEMLSHSQQQDEARLVANSVAAQHLMGGASSNMGPPSSVNMLHGQHSNNPTNNDLTLKLQQAQLQKQQMDMLNKFINAGMHGPHQAHVRGSPNHDLGLQQSRELLNRPEAQAILQGLKRGEITNQHLYQQLANPALQPRHRDMLLTILKLQGGGGGSYGVSPRVLSPVPPPAHHLYQQQQQQLRVSPLPPNAMHQRIPSPRELQVHTQNILQRALIKKKLEEQTENYRKKQEMQRGASPNTQVGGQSGPSKSIASPTPLAFTPTSVLRKMTADKDEGKENKVVGDGNKPVGRPLTGMRPQPQASAQPQWNQQFSIKQPAGRPIVKANPNNYQPMQPQTSEQFFSQAQQHLVAQQQQQQQQRLFNQQQNQMNPQQNQQQQQNVLSQLNQLNQQQQQQTAMNQSRKPGYNNNGGVPQGVNPYGNAPYPSNHQSSFSQQLTQQQLRAQHQHRPVNQQQQASGAAPPQQPANQNAQQGNQGQSAGGAWQQFLNNAQQQQSNRLNSVQQQQNSVPRNPLNDGSLSPTTTDQLARWFSPDLLERARGGELPSTANLSQHVLSLEEIERQTAPPVHN